MSAANASTDNLCGIDVFHERCFAPVSSNLLAFGFDQVPTRATFSPHTRCRAPPRERRGLARIVRSLCVRRQDDTGPIEGVGRLFEIFVGVCDGDEPTHARQHIDAVAQQLGIERDVGSQIGMQKIRVLGRRCRDVEDLPKRALSDNDCLVCFLVQDTSENGGKTGGGPMELVVEPRRLKLPQRGEPSRCRQWVAVERAGDIGVIGLTMR